MEKRKAYTDREYGQRLEEVRHRLLDMSRRVEAMIADSIEALTKRDPELAKKTIEADHWVNRCEVETDELCLLILAKWKPLATDLRFITLALKMVTDLERIGDLAVNLCERVEDLKPVGEFELHTNIPRMAEIVQSMVHESIESFLADDADRAQAVLDRDTEVDKLYSEVFRDEVSTIPQDPTGFERDIHVLAITKWLERMGDHATNLAEQVVFMVKGKDIRHLGKLPSEDEA